MLALMGVRLGPPRPGPAAATASISVSRSSGFETASGGQLGHDRRASPVSTPPGPSSTSVVAPRPFSVSSVWRQRTGLQSWADSRPGQLRRVAVDAGVDVGDDRHLGCEEDRVAERLAEERDRAAAISGVWNAPETGMGITLRAPISRAITETVGYGVGRAGDDDLAGRVVVGHPRVALRPLARGFGVVVGDAEQRGHRSRCVLAGPGHRVAAGDDEVDAVVERRGPPLAHERPVYSPRLWPAQAAGARPSRSTASSTTRLWTNVASWAFAVGGQLLHRARRAGAARGRGRPRSTLRSRPPRTGGRPTPGPCPTAVTPVRET